ncbi:ferric reductase-like transmembrane domain-containing protein [Clostridium beijerinckii]|jgi:DMSO/TMAO reductase YedYZ heme-binding membrane subunit|uniref:Sulfite oxidase heme-binding subunit YedZ n=1 Tax=Clostridium beijerinckii TaxID=1520 RepID=A0AAW3WAG2_CLOBE|nr:ferric reductase-like transmembrane domain-containing protein [Clostridium beijerinckii]MBC2458740.1 sulfite oxidase heme-binding subunit YedZ [Clostridium beijerinckii]MBC2475819.1 sulfite oxidase heme-binding subunit YedZ [Clostridium beijerinckii]MCI1579650.1 ferric reductase-like transmembrane domain-containing protein [Clostridium beijerinckii]MCI1586272.1 ferric reductase-like transmembrane domain-containing protein [Clostridium beijerinckii]MCI1622861.1 ferric reductase-like transmem
MIFICTLILVTILSLLLTSSIKKNYYLYYSLATGIAIITSFYEILRITSNAKLEGVILTLEKTSIRGLISVSFFILVMYAGALNQKWTITKKLRSIRAELAIIGAIMLLPHGIVYFIRFIILKLPRIINEGSLPVLYLSYIAVGLIGFIIMTPLFITSFKKIRRKMQGKQWKRLQRWAYLFYFLTYFHILLILLNEKEIDWVRLISYTIVFINYMALKLLKNKEINIAKSFKLSKMNN